ncbi:beta-microseminoprotein-like [Eleutherodactylus coqui]|uniref:beta-microseminoprotein-like n=1 Tax=Eleutherodactylus coqui TaxID=57060 RepID=UPI003461BDF5
MMKYLWVIALFGAGIFVGICNAACFQSAPKEHEDGDPEGCMYDGVVHEYGSKWRTKECLDCHCSAGGSMTCCQAHGTPKNYDEKNCIKVWDQEACMYYVLRKNATCEHAMVG